MPDEPARRKRRPQRRAQILAAAVRLFHERGYHATGIDDIGAATGMTGPAIYRHFPNKEAILEALIRQRGEHLMAEVEEIAVGAMEPAEALDVLARSYVEEIVDNPSLVAVAMYERRTLSDTTRAWIDRMERRNIDQWVRVVRRVRTDLDELEARVVVHAALTLGVAVCNYKSGLDRDRLVRLVHPMVTTAVLGGRRAPVLVAKARASAPGFATRTQGGELRPQVRGRR